MLILPVVRDPSWVANGGQRTESRCVPRPPEAGVFPDSVGDVCSVAVWNFVSLMEHVTDDVDVKML